MHVYEAEKLLGLEKQINDSKSIIKAQVKIPVNKKFKNFDNLRNFVKNLNKTDGSNVTNIKDLLGQEQPDLALVIAVLVSTGWNLNDDIFLPAELWKSKDTPKHKPMNDGHDQTMILGHIVDSKAVDKDGNELIVKDENSIPEDFDLEVAGVLYKAIPELSERIDEIIAKAQDGSMFVSMEVWFTDFGYGVIDNDGTTKIIDRNEETAFLTKHLKIFGGNGQIENKKIGRVLKNMVFAGQAFTDKPANPNSVIRTAACKTVDILKGGAKSVDLQEQVKNLETKIKALEDASAQKDVIIKELNDKANKTGADLENSAKALKMESEKNIAMTKDSETMKISVDELTKERDELKTKVVNLENKNQEVTKALEEIKKAEVARERFTKLSQIKKIDNKDATLAELKEMTNETFALVLKYASINTEKPNGSQTKIDDDTASAALDNVETKDDDVSMNVNSNEDDEIKANIAMATCLLNKEEEGVNT